MGRVSACLHRSKVRPDKCRLWGYARSAGGQGVPRLRCSFLWFRGSSLSTLKTPTVSSVDWFYCQITDLFPASFWLGIFIVALIKGPAPCFDSWSFWRSMKSLSGNPSEPTITSPKSTVWQPGSLTRYVESWATIGWEHGSQATRATTQEADLKPWGSIGVILVPAGCRSLWCIWGLLCQLDLSLW